MSNTGNVDYEALAKQYGATSSQSGNIDYNALAKQHGAISSTTYHGNEVSAQPSAFSVAGIKKTLYEAADRTTNALPAIGGIIGGMLGAGSGAAAGSIVPGPGTVGGGAAGAIGGAGIGGMMGQAVKQPIREAIFPNEPKLNMSDAAKSIAIEGAKQAGYEAGGRALQAGGRALAPRIVDAAILPGKRLLKSLPDGVDIGKTILDNTKGFSPATISKELEQQIAAKSSELDQMLTDAGAQGARVPLKPARQLVNTELQSAISKNAPGYIKDVNKVGDQLSTQYGSNGQPVGAVPDWVEPMRARLLKQGIDLQIGSWTPEAQSAVGPLQQRVHGAIAGATHNAVPGSAALDRSMSEMIPAKDAAFNTSFNQGVVGKVVDKVARPTGALVAGIYGADKGYEKGGVSGGVAGGALGIGAPILFTTPAGLMVTARIVGSKIIPVAVRYASPLIESQLHPNANLKPSH